MFDNNNNTSNTTTNNKATPERVNMKTPIVLLIFSLLKIIYIWKY